MTEPVCPRERLPRWDFASERGKVLGERKMTAAARWPADQPARVVVCWSPHRGLPGCVIRIEPWLLEVLLFTASLSGYKSRRARGQLSCNQDQWEKGISWGAMQRERVFNMLKKTEDNIPAKTGDLRFHLANERTFLAWIRTSIGLMAFGFVVEKFALFVKQISFILADGTAPSQSGYSSILGILLLVLGVLMGVLAFIRYKKIEKQIDDDSYHPSLLLDILLTISIITIGLFLIIYLLHSI
jgi:putative membrane protein